jgi:hypothetical protein
MVTWAMAAPSFVGTDMHLWLTICQYFQYVNLEHPVQCYFFRQSLTYLLAASCNDKVANGLNSRRSPNAKAAKRPIYLAEVTRELDALVRAKHLPLLDFTLT